MLVLRGKASKASKASWHTTWSSPQSRGYTVNRHGVALAASIGRVLAFTACVRSTTCYTLGWYQPGCSAFLGDSTDAPRQPHSGIFSGARRRFLHPDGARSKNSRAKDSISPVITLERSIYPAMQYGDRTAGAPAKFSYSITVEVALEPGTKYRSICLFGKTGPPTAVHKWQECVGGFAHGTDLVRRPSWVDVRNTHYHSAVI